jgi:hypothetical protein
MEGIDEAEPEVAELRGRLLQALVDGLDEKDYSIVYLREFYQGHKEMGHVLKLTGDQLEKLSRGWIRRRFNPAGWHYVQIGDNPPSRPKKRTARAVV